jgi:hypothetical protein
MAHALVPGFHAEVPPLRLRIVQPQRPGNRWVRRAVGRLGGAALMTLNAGADAAP